MVHIELDRWTLLSLDRHRKRIEKGINAQHALITDVKAFLGCQVSS